MCMLVCVLVSSLLSLLINILSQIISHQGQKKVQKGLGPEGGVQHSSGLGNREVILTVQIGT